MWRYAKWNKMMKGIITGIFALMVVGSALAPEQDSSTPDYVATDTPATTSATLTPEPTDAQVLPTGDPTESPIPTPEPTSSPTEKPTPDPTLIETPAPAPTLSPTIEPTTEPTMDNTGDNVNSENNENSENSGNGDGSNFNTYDNTEQQNTEDTWVLNTSSKKIHYPSCKSVPKIAPQNYKTSSESLDDLKAKGYTTCGNCF